MKNLTNFIIEELSGNKKVIDLSNVLKNISKTKILLNY